MSVVDFELRGVVGLITINRPKALNALNAEVLTELGAIVAEYSHHPTVRALVLTGAGRAFVAGADISAMLGLSCQEAEAFAALGQGLAAQIAACPIPVIAAVNGFALGGGCELALACDIILAGPKALFGQPEVKLGVIPGFGGTQRLVRRVGLTKALDLCLTARNVKAEEAVQMGLAARAIDGDVVEAALEVANTIASMGPVAVRYAKQAIHDNADADLSTGLAAEKALFALCFATNDQSEGMAAFLEKRTPTFTGR